MTLEEFLEFIEKYHDIISGFTGDGRCFQIMQIYKDIDWKIRCTDKRDTYDVYANEIFEDYDSIVFHLNKLVKVKNVEYFRIQGIYQTDEIEYIKSALKTLADLQFDKGSLTESREISDLLEKIEDNITKEE